MKQGTVSVLFGCHSATHSLVVYIAWIKLYRRLPNYWETGCIFLHDIGHWGKNYLDDYELKKRHAELGAKVAKRLFGQKGYDMVVGHNAYTEQTRSLLYLPDKLSWTISPTLWLYLNNFIEPKLVRPGATKWQSAVMYKKAMLENEKTGFQQQGHDIYMSQMWQGGKDAKN
jgi:hypothetical protein